MIDVKAASYTATLGLCLVRHHIMYCAEPYSGIAYGTSSTDGRKS